MTAHATSADVTSFYHLPDGLPARAACRGLACFVARDENPGTWTRACSSEPRVYCLGQCHRSPAAASDPIEEPTVEVRAPHGVVLGGIVSGPESLDAYRRRGGYGLVDAVRRQPPAHLIEAI